MKNVVKLILICQIKDDNIPQLIPLMWIFSVVMRMFLFNIYINIYRLKEIYGLKGGEIDVKVNFVNLLW